MSPARRTAARRKTSSSTTEPPPAPQAPPYPPGFTDHIAKWVDRLPIPWWSFYLLLAATLSGLVALGLWQTGVYAAVGFHPIQVWLPTLTAYLLGLMHALNRAASGAMRRLRPSFSSGEPAFAASLYHLTTLPSRPTWAAALLGVISTPFGRAELGALQTGGLERLPALFLVVLAALYVVAYPFFYQLWHQFREIHRLHRDHVRVNLADIRPMYALARVTSLGAIGIAIFTYGWLLAQPGLRPDNPVFLLESGLSLAIALVLFVWPLWGAHRMLVEAKETALAEVAGRKAAARIQLHQVVDTGRLDQVDPLHKALGALQAESVELAAVPTWPWAPGTLRNLAGAVLLPVTLWLIQFGLGRLLG